jgi:nucleotide-binding universal stress UspA family protein
MTMPERIAYIALNTYPEAVADAAILSCVDLAAALRCALHATAFTVEVPPVYSPLGGMLINIPDLVRATEARSRAEGERLKTLVQQAAGGRIRSVSTRHEVVLGGALDAAAREARYFDLVLLPWSGETLSAQDMAQAMIFGSGRPTILVPAAAPVAAPIDHVAVAWDESRAAARAIGDVLPLLAEGGRVTVLTVHDEKTLGEADLARTLASTLEARGVTARAVEVALGDRTIAAALQEAALAEGAKLLAMGGFGHSRLRDFILGGATKGVLADLRLAVLLSH